MPEKQELFEGTAKYIKLQMVKKIRAYKSKNNIKLYDFLFLKNKNNSLIYDYDEPYYGRTKQTATQTMSRVLNKDYKITDEMSCVISDNMKIDSSEFIWEASVREVSVFRRNNIFFIFCKILEDAFISNKYNEIIKNMFIDYIPFSKIIVDRALIYQNYSEYRKELLLNDEEFKNVFSNASKRLFDKIDISLIKENEVGFVKFYSDFFCYKDNSLKNISGTIEVFFSLCEKELFGEQIASERDSQGLIVYNLLEWQNELIIPEYEIFYNKNEIKKEYLELQKSLKYSNEIYINSLEIYQKKVDQLEKGVLL
ncbi:hypothetical protein ACQUD9_08585 [Vagococcus fluvialis]|uniref:hypothetical protein n=1 Tax=Vagococcus fluvialis TaxID=2738 RepID=UPI003D1522B6